MSSTRTQIYLTREQRQHLDRLAELEDRSLAAVIRDAVDQYLDRTNGDPSGALAATYGVAPDFEVPPRGEWDR